MNYMISEQILKLIFRGMITPLSSLLSSLPIMLTKESPHLPSHVTHPPPQAHLPLTKLLLPQTLSMSLVNTVTNLDKLPMCVISCMAMLLDQDQSQLLIVLMHFLLQPIMIGSWISVQAIILQMSSINCISLLLIRVEINWL